MVGIEKQTVMHNSIIFSAVTFTLNFGLELFITSEEQDENEGLGSLEHNVDEGEEIQGPDDLRREGHLQDGCTQLDVLAACLHRDSPSTSDHKKKDKLCVTLIQQCVVNVKIVPFK